MMTLAIETSSNRGTIALGVNGSLLHEVEFSEDARHSQAIFPALTKIGLPRLTIGRVEVGLGPGSFSGIRVALSTAHAIAAVQGCEVFGIPSTYAMALRHRNVTRLGIFADARRNEYYVTVFSRGELERDTYLIPKAQLSEEVSKMTMALAPDFLPDVPHHEAPHASDLLAIPEEHSAWQSGYELQPVYLREPTIAKPSKGKRAAPAT